MPSTLLCAGILFDSDGVLVRSQPVIDRILADWAAKHHLDPQEVIELSRGRRDVELVRMVAPWLDAGEEARLLEERELSDLDGIEEVPGARRLLDALPADRWAVVTSGSGSLVRNRLNAAALPEPDVVISADDVTAGKPDPEGYLCAARKLGTDPAECLVFEDSPTGVAAGIAAGSRVIGVLTTATRDTLPADMWIDDLREVTLGDDVRGSGDPGIALKVGAPSRQ